jgi:hypothetical protein
MGSRILVGLLTLGSLAGAQSLLEHSAAAAGGSVGGVAGKKVSDGLTSIFEKVDKHAQKAAKAATSTTPAVSGEPLLEVGPGVPKQRASVPPPPPPLHHATTVRKAPAPLPLARVPVPMLSPEVEPAPQVTSAELRGVTAGMRRADVLKLGQPAARITMYDDGHLVEIYRYLNRDADLGAVRLTDGSVSSVQVR